MWREFAGKYLLSQFKRLYKKIVHSSFVLLLYQAFVFIFSSSASLPTLIWGRCFGSVIFKQLDLALLRQIMPSLSRHTWCCPSTSVSIYLSFSFPAHPSPSLFYANFPFSLLMTCSHHFPHFLGYFSHLHCPPNSFVPYSVHVCDTTHPPQHHFLCPIQLLLLLWFLYFPCLAPFIIAGLSTVLYTFNWPSIFNFENLFLIKQLHNCLMI